MALGRPLGSKNRTLPEIKRDAELELAKAKVKMLEAKKKKAEADKKVAQKKAQKL